MNIICYHCLLYRDEANLYRKMQGLSVVRLILHYLLHNGSEAEVDEIVLHLGKHGDLRNFKCAEYELTIPRPSSRGNQSNFEPLAGG